MFSQLVTRLNKKQCSAGKDAGGRGAAGMVPYMCIRDHVIIHLFSYTYMKLNAKKKKLSSI